MLQCAIVTDVIFSPTFSPHLNTAFDVETFLENLFSEIVVRPPPTVTVGTGDLARGGTVKASLGSHACEGRALSLGEERVASERCMTLFID